MYDKLKKELNKFLIDYSITGMDGFNDWVFQQAGVVRKNNENVFHSGSSGSDTIYFSVSDFDLNELAIIFKFFNIDPASYRAARLLKVNSAQIMDVLLPGFKAYVQSVALSSPKILRPYQIASKSELESNAVRNIQANTNDLLKKIISEKADALTLEKKQLRKLLLQIRSVTELLSSNNLYSECIFDAQEDLQQLLENNPALQNEPRLNVSLKELQSAFSAYARFNRVEVVRAVKQFFYDAEALLNTHTISLSNCDIFEETLLKMAGITQMPQKSQFEISYDPTRISIKLTGMTKEEVQPLIDFFHAHGDDTASINRNSNRDYYALESLVEQSGVMFSDRKPKPQIPVQTVYVDGEVLVNKIFPLFVERLNDLALNSPEVLLPYQQKSAEYFENMPQKSPAIHGPGSSSIFHHPVEQVNSLVDMDATTCLKGAH